MSFQYIAVGTDIGEQWLKALLKKAADAGMKDNRDYKFTEATLRMAQRGLPLKLAFGSAAYRLQYQLKRMEIG